MTCVPQLAEQPNLIVLRTMSKAFGLAALRVGWAVAAPEVAAELELRRPPASVGAPAARIAAAALREPRLDIEATIAERQRVQEALAAARVRLPPGATATSSSSAPTSRSARDSRRQGLVVREFSEGIRITLRRGRENDVLLAALGAAIAPVGRCVTRSSSA